MNMFLQHLLLVILIIINNIIIIIINIIITIIIINNIAWLMLSCLDISPSIEQRILEEQ